MSLKLLYKRLGALPAYLFVNISTRAMNMAAFIFLAFTFSSEEYGNVEYIISIFFLTCIVVDCQLISYFSREYYSAKKDNSLGKLLGTVILSYFGITFVAVFLLILANGVLRVSVTEVILIVVSAFMHSIIELYFMYLRLEDKVGRYVKLSLIVYIVLSSALILPAIIGTHYLASLYAYLGGKIVLGLCVLSLIRTSYILGFSRRYFTKSFQYSLPLVPNVGIGWLLFNMPKTFFGWQGQMDQVAVFSVASRFASILQLIVVAFKNAWYPLLCRYVSHEEGVGVHQEIYRELSRYLKLYIGFVFLVLVIGMFCTLILLDTKLGIYSNVIFCLIVAHLCLGLLSFYSFYFMEIRKTHFLTLVYFLGGMFSSFPYLVGSFPSLEIVSAFIALGTFCAFIVVYALNPKRAEFNLVAQ